MAGIQTLLFINLILMKYAEAQIVKTFSRQTSMRKNCPDEERKLRFCDKKRRINRFGDKKSADIADISHNHTTGGGVLYFQLANFLA